MPLAVKLGQKWSVWVPSRQQWLLATVVSCESGTVILGYDARYGMPRGEDRTSDEGTMLTNRNLYRFIEP
jgi:hypothetical protein